MAPTRTHGLQNVPATIGNNVGPNAWLFQANFSAVPHIGGACRIFSNTCFACASLPSTPAFSAAEFQSGYCVVASITRSIHAEKYFASSGERAGFPLIVAYTGLVVAYT